MKKLLLVCTVALFFACKQAPKKKSVEVVEVESVEVAETKALVMQDAQIELQAYSAQEKNCEWHFLEHRGNMTARVAQLLGRCHLPHNGMHRRNHANWMCDIPLLQ